MSVGEKSFFEKLPEDWQEVLHGYMISAERRALEDFLAEEYHTQRIFPTACDLFTAFRLTPFRKVRVVIFGQDPYPGENQAHGLSFSVRKGVPIPRSLKNIFKELNADIGCSIPESGDLTAWAEQGVLLLNDVLTVRAHSPMSHRGKGWELFTDSVLQVLAKDRDGLVFVLWGNAARAKAGRIDTGRHHVIESAHPSPLSARHGFFGSRPFSRINEILGEEGKIRWDLTDLGNHG